MGARIFPERERLVPYCAFTDHELGRVGLNETEARRRGLDVRVVRLPMTSVLRVGLALCAPAVLVALFPRMLAYPAAALGLWGGLALLWRAIGLRWGAKHTSSFDKVPAA